MHRLRTRHDTAWSYRHPFLTIGIVATIMGTLQGIVTYNLLP